MATSAELITSMSDVHDNSSPDRNSPGALSSNTYVMSASPTRPRKGADDSYRPKLLNTIGQRPACLVSASGMMSYQDPFIPLHFKLTLDLAVTYVGNSEIYAFGGFDQYTDEVYNHVLRLNLETRQWNLVDNYGDIPGVRMGHTATLWKGEKVLIFGGENEHRAYLSDLIIFDLKTAYWQQPELRGTTPKGRARHSAVIYDDKLFIIGGLSGHDNSTILEDFCFLDLKTWTWSRTWRFVPRFDHTCWIWGGKLWIFGGLTEGMERVNDLWWLDLKQSPIFNGGMPAGTSQTATSSVRNPRPLTAQSVVTTGTGSGYAANSSSVQTQASTAVSRKPPMAPGSISSINFCSGPNIPPQALGTHFHAYSSGCMLDLVTPGVTGTYETSICALDFETMRWEKLAEGREIFNPDYRWHYCALNQEGTHAWLLGCPVDPPANVGGVNGEYLSDVLCLDLRKLGLLGNSLAIDSRGSTRLPNSDAHIPSLLSGISADLARMFDNPNSATDFVITGEADFDASEKSEGDMMQDVGLNASSVSRPIHVHRLILEARWPHFSRMLSAQMAEFHSKKLHVPEPYSVLRAFLYYLYTDSIVAHPGQGPDISAVAGMLVLSSCYDMPRLRTLCRNRLGRELEVEHAALIWDSAGTAGEEWLKKRAARFCMTHWGRVVQSSAFRELARDSIVELCQEVDEEGRVVGAEELEAIGGLGGAKFSPVSSNQRSRRLESTTSPFGGDETEADDDNESMEI